METSLSFYVLRWCSHYEKILVVLEDSILQLNVCSAWRFRQLPAVVWVLCDRRCAARPTRPLHRRLQISQQRPVRIFFCLLDSIRSPIHRSPPSYITFLRKSLSLAVTSRETESMWQSFNVAWRVSLNRSFGRLSFLVPCSNSPYMSSFRRRIWGHS